MAKFQDKTSVKSAKTDSSKVNLSGITVTTTDFFKPIPIRTIPVIPGDKISIKTQSFVRLKPLAVPTFGRIEMINRWFFVPYRSIYRGWNSFIDRVPYKANVLRKVPVCTNKQLVQAFLSGLRTPSSWTPGLEGDYATVIEFGPAGTTGGIEGKDFGLWLPNDSIVAWFKFNTRGRHILSILNSLGYGINFSLADETEMSLLPLLSYFRVYLDYYSDPQQAVFYEQYFDMYDSTFDIDGLLDSIFAHITNTHYDFDYFTSAWQNPESPSDNSTSLSPDINIVDITSVPSSPSSSAPINVVEKNNVNQYNSNTYVIKSYSNTAMSTATNIRGVSHYMLDALKAVSNYSRRHNLIGWRIMDRYLGDYGKRLDYSQLNQSLFLNSKIVPIQISDVTSTADSYTEGQGKVLGAYAGKGLGFDQFDLQFSIDKEFGMLICISSLIPKTGYYQGRCKQQGVLSIAPLDFYHGDFDGLGVQAIRLDELFADAKYSGELSENWSGTYKPTSIFGYQPRYAEYKSAYDTLSGDFRVNTLKTGADSFHLFREVFPSGTVYDVNSPELSDLRSITPAFRVGSQEQFDRIFTMPSDIADHFDCFHNFEIKAKRNVLSISESLLDDTDYQNDEVSVNRDGTMFN